MTQVKNKGKCDKMMTDDHPRVWPIEIRCNIERNKLSIRFDNGDQAELSAELLRVESPSAEVQGHGPGQKQTPRDKKDVTITKITAVGSYAVRLTFSDGHDTGIYSWKYFQWLAANKKDLWARYIEQTTGEAGSIDYKSYTNPGNNINKE